LPWWTAFARCLIWASELFEQSLEAFRNSGYKVDINWALNNLGRVVAGQGDRARAAELFGESLALAYEQEDQWNVATALEGLAMLGGPPIGLSARRGC
jgi:Tetratricopeptide repeat